MITAIQFENVSKKYKLYSKGGLYLRDRITHALQRLNPFNGANQSVVGNPSETASSSPSLERDFLALNSISFKIEQGESVGFIGPNGAGKSTILKLLAGVTKPSSGNVQVNGRIAALIEVGAGFHPELTGRENVYLNGTILGMKRWEIDQVFDRIVEFAELEEFIDTPVKHYSSGMYVRLGFSIATHSNPDIFLIDEVLAVGDEAFQNKCMDTMAAHKASGKTMILVSHQLNKIEDLCNRCIYLNKGRVALIGTPKAAIRQYRKEVSRMALTHAESKEIAEGTLINITNVIFRDVSGCPKTTFNTGETLVIETSYNAFHPLFNVVLSLAIYNTTGDHITTFNNRTSAVRLERLEGEGRIFCRLNNIPLGSGAYYLSVAFHDYDCVLTYDYHHRRYEFEVDCQEKWSEGSLFMKGEWATDLEFRRGFEADGNSRRMMQGR
jgi:lipopolysaccharide transport system ATP-binding protein